MAAVAFDSLQYAHQLEAAGMPRKQAEVIAQGLTSMFVHNFESLVTKDYLDTRFSEQSVRMDLLATGMDSKLDLFSADIDSRLVKFDSRLAKFDSRLDHLSATMDSKLGHLSATMDSNVDHLLTTMDSKIDLLLATMDGKLGRLYVMFVVIMVGLAIPIIQTLITWLG